jgi:two-component system LytT family response regulator
MSDSAPLKAIIVDDEVLARQDLRRLLERQGGVTVVGEIATLADGVAGLARPDYNLVFLDVQLRGGSGFDLLPHVRPEASVIFVTAHDQHAVRAFEVNALDYLLKPVVAARLAGALARVPPPGAREPAAVAPPAAPPTPFQPDDLVHLKLGALNTRLVALAHIAAVSSCENYSEVQMIDGARHFVRQTMKTWEERLPSTHFVRVHRHAIVGLTHYRGIDYVPDGTSRLHVAGMNEPLPASYRYVPELKSRLVALGRDL